MEKPLIEIKNASAGYGDSVILHNVSLTINDKDFIGIIGPNGGGKTTLLRLMLGQIEPIEGFVNNNITPSNLRGAVGYLPQVSTIDKKFPITVIDVVLSGLMSSKGFSNKFTKAEKERAEAILLKTGIFDYRKKTIAALRRSTTAHISLQSINIGSISIDSRRAKYICRQSVRKRTIQPTSRNQRTHGNHYGFARYWNHYFLR